MVTYPYLGLCDMKRSHIEKFLKRCFTLLNGKINPINPATKISFSTKHGAKIIHQPGDRVTRLTGWATLSTVVFDVDYIIDILYAWLNDREYNVPKIHAYLLSNAAHELSHLDQDIRKCSNLDMMEYVNEMNIRNYITIHRDLLTETFGELDFEAAWAISGYNVLQEKYGHCKYARIPSIYVRLIEIFEKFQLDIHKISSDETIHAINFVLLNTFRKYDDIFELDADLVFRNLGDVDVSYKHIHKLMDFISEEIMINYQWKVIRMFDAETNEICLLLKSVTGTANSVIFSMEISHYVKDERICNYVLQEKDSTNILQVIREEV